LMPGVIRVTRCCTVHVDQAKEILNLDEPAL
jgi:hypothetical protein